MSELKPCPCPICGAELKIYGPEDWHPTFYDPDSGGDPYNAVCDCGFSFSTGTYDYAEFVAALNRRSHPTNDPLTFVKCADCVYGHIEQWGETWCGRFNGGIYLCSTDFCSHGIRRPPERSENE